MAWTSCRLPLVLGMMVMMTSLMSGMTSAATQNVAQVRIYVEKAAASKWIRITGKSSNYDFRREMNSTFFEVNEIFKSLKTYNVDIQLQIDDVIFLNNNILNADYNDRIISSDSLAQFERWVSSRYSNDKYDMALLFTGYDMVQRGQRDGSYGEAYVSQVCSVKALSVLELSATYVDVAATAHEIGHILGSDHDGEKGSINCNSKSGEVMNPMTEYSSPRRFYFSRCSANSIANKISQLAREGKNCMDRWYYASDITGPRYASLLSEPDEICRRKVGSHSYIARKAYASYGDAVCLTLSCMTKTVGTRFYWTNVVTPEGLRCGKNKQCIKGKCVQTYNGSGQVSDICPFGDQPKLEGNFQTTCDQMTSSQCQNFKQTCCQTCNVADPGTADDVCRRIEGRNSSMARRAYSGNYGNTLCSKLACLTRVEGTHWYWNYHTAPDGMKCGKSKICTKGQCVSNRAGDPNISDTCPFGDQPWLAGSWRTTCSDYVTQNGCTGNGWKETCCSSCNDPGTADEVCKSLTGSSDSVMARRAYTDYGNTLCSKLACLTRVEGTHFYWNTYKAPDGMACGYNKRCSSGQCVTTKAGDPSMSDSCPFGDQPWLAGSWRTTCHDYVRQNGCDGNGWKQICCHSCNTIEPGTADEVCRQKLGKNSAMARRAYSGYYGNDLCSKLACLTRVDGTHFYWRTYTAPDRMKCGQNKRCSNGQCVYDQTGDPSMSDRCPYGDQPWLAGSWQKTCHDYVRQNGCTGNGWKETCCSSC